MKQPIREFLQAAWNPESERWAWEARCPDCKSHLGQFAWGQRREAEGAAERHQCQDGGQRSDN